MAVVTLQKGFNFNATQAWPYTITESTADTLTLEGDIQSLTLHGEYQYEGDQISGVVEEASFMRNGNDIYTMTDLGRSASLLQDALSLVTEHDEPEILLAYLLGGDDQLTGSINADFLKGYDGNDWLSGSGGADRLFGNVGNDVVLGGAGNDILRGGYGDDIIGGGSGDNIIFSGKGSDTIIINDPSPGVDTIVNLESTDTIQLNSGAGAAFSDLGANGALDADLFASNAGGNAVDADDRILYDSDTGALYYDADGSGAGAKMQFALIGAAGEAVTAADFSVYNV